MNNTSDFDRNGIHTLVLSQEVGDATLRPLEFRFSGKLLQQSVLKLLSEYLDL
jgi:hypothetical protein